MFACDQNQAFFDKEITLQKQDIANIENNTFKFQNERLKSCYMISHSLGDGSFGFVYEGVRYSDGLNVGSHETVFINLKSGCDQVHSKTTSGSS